MHDVTSSASSFMPCHALGFRIPGCLCKHLGCLPALPFRLLTSCREEVCGSGSQKCHHESKHSIFMHFAYSQEA